MPSFLEDKEAIRELLSSYCFHTDRKDADARAALFTEDAVWDAGGKYGRFEGKPALREYMAKSASRDIKFRHFTANEVITVAGDTASALSYVLVLKLNDGGAPELFSARYYEDKLVKSGGRWLFKSRIVQAN